MPVMDGWQVIDQLRADGRLAKTQIVIITSAPYRAPAGLPVFQKPLDLDKVMTRSSASADGWLFRRRDTDLH